MCGGTYEKWTAPKWLTEVCGEPLIARTIRLLREEGARDIAISSADPRFDAFGVPRLQHDNDYTLKRVNESGCWVHGFYPTEEPACYLMGDVVFSPEAIRKIVGTETDGILFFASAPPFSPLYIKPWAEPFAFKVADQARFRQAIRFVEANVNTGIFRRHPVSWELWQVINGNDLNSIDFDTITAINDYTCDIDDPQDAEKIEQMIGDAAAS